MSAREAPPPSRSALATQLLGLLIVSLFSVLTCLAAAWPLAQSLWEAWRARNWQPVAAEVIDARMERGHKGVAWPVVSYRYQHAGRSHVSRRLGIQSGAERNDARARQWIDTLQLAKARGTTVTVWVDPERPASAVVDRTLRPNRLVAQLPFAVLSLLSAAAAVWLTVHIVKRQWVRRRAVASDFSAAESATGVSVFLIWGFVLLWWSVCLPIFLLNLARGDRDWSTWLPGIFCLAGTLFLQVAWKAQRRAWRTRGTVLQYRCHVTSDGPELAVSLMLPRRRVVNARSLRLRLQQYEVDLQVSGHSERLVDNTDITLPVPTGQAGDVLALHPHLLLPPGALPSGTLRNGMTQHWRLQLEGTDDGETQNFSLELTFPIAPATVPTRRPSQRATGDAQLNASVLATTVPAPLPELRLLSDGERWVAQLQRPLWRAGAVLFAGMSVAFFFQARSAFHDSDRWEVVVALAWLFAAMACAGQALHLASKQWRLIVDAGGLTLDLSSALRCKRRALGHPSTWGRRMTYRQGSEEYYRLVAGSQHGDRKDSVVLSPSLSGTIKVDSLAAQLLQAMSQRRGRFVSPETASEAGEPTRWRLPLLALCVCIALTATALVAVAPAHWADIQGWPMRAASAWQARLERLSPSAARREALIAAVEQADIGGLTRALGVGADPNARADTGSTLLMLAARRGNLEQVELLLVHGANVNAADETSNHRRGDTALLVALYGGHEDVARRLIAAGASLQARNMWDWGPAHMAAQSGSVECLELLKEYGVSLNDSAPASRGETPAMLAAARGRLDALRWLVAHGAELGQRDLHGYDALGWAQFGKQVEAAQWIKATQARSP